MRYLFILLLLALIKSVLLYRAYHILPVKELKRRARAKDHQASALYKVAAHCPQLDVLLFISGSLSAAAVFIMAARATWWLAAATILFTAWLLVWAPRPKVGGWIWHYGVFAAKPIFWIVDFLHVFLGPVASLLPASARLHMHTGIYEKEDLLELIDAQKRQPDSNLSEEDLKIAEGALTFGDKKVGDIMTPRRAVRFVSENEAVGPMLMDELHATGFSRLPVTSESVKAASPKVTGMLYVKDLIDHADKGRVRDVMRKKAAFINESCSLHQALDAFLKSHQHLLVVVNNFEEVAGVITLEDVLEQILGTKITDEFDKYDDLRAVAGIEAERERKNHNEEVVAPKPE